MTTRKALARLFLSLSVLLFAAATTRTAFAQNARVEAAAKALQKKAMDEDYLATEFTKGQDKLNKAITSCGADKCSAPLRASLKRDLGVMQIGGQLDRDAGIANFVEALKIDPAIALDPDMRTKDLDAAWADAKKRAGGGGKVAPTGPIGAQPTGDFVHEPAALQQIRTPIPIYAEYSGEEQLVKVIVRYKGFGMTDWKPLELKKTGDKGWSGQLPCADVQQGITQYYIQGFNAANDPVAVGGDRNNAYKVKVQREAVNDPPHLPGQSPPTQCADTGDCPPGFPGCKKAASTELTGKDGGEFCEEDSECKSKDCKGGKCTEPPNEGKSGGYRKWWLGVSVGFDYQFVPSSNDVCLLNASSAANPLTPVNSKNYYCVQQSDNSDYPYRPTSLADQQSNPRGLENVNLQAGQSDKVSGGGAFGNIRLALSLDYAVTSSILVGVRLGATLLTYPGDAAKADGNRFGVPWLEVEARGTFLLRKDALMEFWSPYVMVAAGLSTYESKVSVSVIEQDSSGTKTPKQVDAWHLAGPGYGSVGGGVRIAASERVAFLGGLRLNLAFGNASVFSVGPEIAVQFGF